MKRLLELDPELKVAKLAVPRLEAAANAKLEEQKEEMMGKLKELGEPAATVVRASLLEPAS